MNDGFVTCPSCGSSAVGDDVEGSLHMYTCKACGYVWDALATPVGPKTSESTGPTGEQPPLACRNCGIALSQAPDGGWKHDPFDFTRFPCDDPQPPEGDRAIQASWPRRIGPFSTLPGDTHCPHCLSKGLEGICESPRGHAKLWMHECEEHEAQRDPWGERSHWEGKPLKERPVVGKKVRDTEKPQQCEYGKHPATKSLLWAEGMAYIPVCDEHEGKGRARIREVYDGEPPDAVHEIRKSASVSRDNADLGGKPFAFGLVNLLDGRIEETVPYERARQSDFHHSFFLPPGHEEGIQAGEKRVFWVEDDGEPAAMEGLPPHIKGAIKEQISRRASHPEDPRYRRAWEATLKELAAP